MISFSLVFFMIFYISPRGESMQMYQKGIYEWNKNRLADHMSSLEFKYFVQPYFDDRVGNVGGYDLPHTDQDEMEVDTRHTNSDESTSEAEFEDTIRSIYYYQQSYFRADRIVQGVFPHVSFRDKPDDSPSYCISTEWKTKDDYLGNYFIDTDDQPLCVNSNPIDA